MRLRIQQREFMDLELSFGALGIIIQGEGLVTVERQHALELADKLAAWAASAALNPEGSDHANR